MTLLTPFLHTDPLTAAADGRGEVIELAVQGNMRRSSDLGETGILIHSIDAYSWLRPKFLLSLDETLTIGALSWGREIRRRERKMKMMAAWGWWLLEGEEDDGAGGGRG
ncbi:unnamed protein product [Linum trigynum]|uniref:Uncharacterized protein n=1 Tax=Linum trigynum TaxID=586398 RepID=A0AAV2FVQ9_9ROSI